jgi:hypothetical protein
MIGVLVSPVSPVPITQSLPILASRIFVSTGIKIKPCQPFRILHQNSEYICMAESSSCHPIYPLHISISHGCPSWTFSPYLSLDSLQWMHKLQHTVEVYKLIWVFFYKELFWGLYGRLDMYKIHNLGLVIEKRIIICVPWYLFNYNMVKRLYWITCTTRPACTVSHNRFFLNCHVKFPT